MKLSIILAALAVSVGSVFAQVRSSEGTDFWTAFPKNDPNNSEAASLSITVTSHYGAIVTTRMTVGVIQRIRIDTSRWGFTAPYDSSITRIDTLAANSAVVIPVDTINNLSTFFKTGSHSIHLTSTAPVRVYTLSHKYASSDGVTVFPTELLGTEYMLIAHKNEAAGYRTYGSIATVIAPNDSTFITVTRGSNAALPNQPTVLVVGMKKGDTYSITADTSVVGADLTGTVITSTRPIVVLSGVERCFVEDPQITGQQSRNFEIEQMLPVRDFRSSFLAIPTAGVGSPNLRIVAAHDTTRVTIGDSSRVLQRGQFMDRRISKVTLIDATRPILVAEEHPSSDNGPGDPFMALVSPSQAWDTAYVVHLQAIRDTLSPKTSTTFFDFNYRSATSWSPVPTYVRLVTKRLDSVYIGTNVQYKLVTSVSDTTFRFDSVYVHNYQGTKTYMLDHPTFYELHLSAVMSDAAVPSFLVDGVRPPASSIIDAGIPGYRIYSAMTSAGTHVVNAALPFSLFPHAYGIADAYGYLAGVVFHAMEDTATVEVHNPLSSTKPGTPHFVTCSPNPFSESSLLRFVIPERAQVSLIVTDLLGNIVTTLTDGVMAEGTSSCTWQPHGTGNVYFYTYSLTRPGGATPFHSESGRLIRIQ